VRTILARDGVTGFYRGLSAQMAMSIHGGIQFAVYEEIKSILARIESDGRVSPLVSCSLKTFDNTWYFFALHDIFIRKTH
jgi:hypothetical protein